MRRIFLDVGANTGQSLAAALDPVFRFDKIFCFEPVSDCWHHLESFADARVGCGLRVNIRPFGLWNKTCAKPIFEPGSLGASLWHKDKARSDESELCQFVRATDWFKENIKGVAAQDWCQIHNELAIECRDLNPHGESSDTVFLKLNCEGAECDILDDLLDSGEFRKVSFVMIDFDVRKIASQKHREAEIRERLKDIGFPRVATSKEVMRGPTHEARIKNWLNLVMENG